MSDPAINNFIEFKLLTDKATLPTRGSPDAAGLDLYAAEDINLPAISYSPVSTGLSMQIRLNPQFPSYLTYYARVAPRSGLAMKFIDVGAGVVDIDYRGEIKVILYNHSPNDYFIHAGDRIAQLIVECCLKTVPIAVQELSATQRGAGGFGSTGK